MKGIIVFLVAMILSGCSSFFKEPVMYTPPVNSSEIAKIRLIGPPMSYALYQKESSGKVTGGWVMKHNRFMNPFLGSTKDIGLPKVTGKEYKDDYFETYLKPEELTSIHHSLYQGCRVDISFTPKAHSIYEALISYGDKSGYCVLSLKEIVFDEVNYLYVEKDISK